VRSFPLIGSHRRTRKGIMLGEQSRFTRQGMIMNALGKTTWAGFGWLTAVMTLVAGLPHFQCQCPNGAIKPFCFGVFCSSSACCCGNGSSGGPKDSRRNARPVAGRKGRPACCCGRTNSLAKPKDSGGPPCVDGKGCQKSLTQQQQFAPTTPTKIVHDPGAADPALCTSAALALLASARTPDEVSRLHFADPPPPDLVIVLQRFLI
jgi:hypothetical protein